MSSSASPHANPIFIILVTICFNHLVCVNCLSVSTLTISPSSNLTSLEKERNSSPVLELSSDIDHALSNAPSGRESPELVIKSWAELMNRAENVWAKDFVSKSRQTLRQIYNASGHHEISTDCRESLDRVLSSIQNLDDWAIKSKFFAHSKRIIPFCDVKSQQITIIYSDWLMGQVSDGGNPGRNLYRLWILWWVYRLTTEWHNREIAILYHWNETIDATEA